MAHSLSHLTQDYISDTDFFLVIKIPGAPNQLSRSTDGIGSVEAIRKELDAEIAGECPRNGEIVIRMIEKPFIDPDVDRGEMEGWKIKLRGIN